MNDNIYLGWDIGGANTKVAIFNSSFEVIDFYFKTISIWNNLSTLKDFLKDISKIYKNSNTTHFISLTAESCDNFNNRDHGVISIVNLCDTNLVGLKKYYSNNNQYISFKEAVKNPQVLYSTNWMLTLNYLNNSKQTNLIIDIGSTTTDFVYKDMCVNENINDFMRLANRTLLYQGVVRTPIPMFVDNIIFGEKKIPVIKEVYATSGDIFCILKDIEFKNKSYIGADELPYSEQDSLNRISRLIGKDYNKYDRELVISVVKDLKAKFIINIVKNIKYIEKLIGEKLIISSIGEGRSLIQEICYNEKIEFLTIDKIDDLKINCNNKGIDVYSHFTSVLIVLNYFGKKDE